LTERINSFRVRLAPMHTHLTTSRPLFLASSSPRRRQLLEALGLPFRVVPAETDEKHPQFVTLNAVITENALAKAKAGFLSAKDKTGLIIGADTLVAVSGKVLGKPKDPADASQMLRALSGRTHHVMTGVALVTSDKVTTFVETSEVVFHSLSDAEIESYIATHEPYDKAGGYAIQGASCLFIEKIVGSYTNVMGLPIESLLRQLEAHTGVPAFQWFARRQK